MNIYSIVRGEGGLQFCLGSGISYFCYLWPHAKFRNPRTTYPPFPPKNAIVRGVGGVPDFFFIGRVHAVFRNPTTTPYGVLNNGMFMKIIFRFMKIISGA